MPKFTSETIVDKENCEEGSGKSQGKEQGKVEKTGNGRERRVGKQRMENKNWEKKWYFSDLVSKLYKNQRQKDLAYYIRTDIPEKVQGLMKVMEVIQIFWEWAG